MDVYKTDQFIKSVEDFDLEEQVIDLEQKIQDCKISMKGSIENVPSTRILRFKVN